jgi:hypothetical protein
MQIQAWWLQAQWLCGAVGHCTQQLLHHCIRNLLCALIITLSYIAVATSTSSQCWQHWQRLLTLHCHHLLAQTAEQHQQQLLLSCAACAAHAPLLLCCCQPLPFVT